MQITTGIRSILSIPLIYSFFQYLMGSKKGWKMVVNEYIRPHHNCLILDIGCGPADILNYLPEVDYWGFDISDVYISKAKEKYGNRGQFFSKILTCKDLDNMPTFDLVIASGLLHHVDDEGAKSIFTIAHNALKPNGRMITIDPCFIPKQNLIARFLISKDRGQNVRNQLGYETLANEAFSHVNVHIKHKAWIPYTHCIMECTK